MGGAQVSRLRVLGPEANGGKGQMGASWAVSQDPSGDLGLFLNPFLPLLARAAARRGRGNKRVGPKRLRNPNTED